MPLPLSPPSASVHSRFPLPLDRETDSPSCFGIHCATQSHKMSLHKCQNQYVTHTRMKDPTKQIAWEQTRIMTEKYIHCELSVKQVLILDGIMSLWPTAELGSSHGSLSHCQEKKTWQGGWWSLSNNSVLFMMSFTIPIIRKKIMIPKRNTKPRETTFFLQKRWSCTRKYYLMDDVLSESNQKWEDIHTAWLTESEFTRVSPNENSIEKKTNFVHKQGKIYAAQQKTAEKTQMSSLEVQICGVQNTQFNSSRLLFLLLLLLLQKDRKITTWKMGDKKAGNPKNEHGVKCRENWPPKRP